MAGTYQNFQIYQEEFHTAVSEAVAQAAVELNGGAGGAFNLQSVIQQGDFDKETFFQRVEGLVSRRDNSSIADINDLEMTQGELVAVKINTKIGPVAQTLDAFKKIAQDPQVMSFVLGTQYGEDVVLDYLNTSLTAAVAAMSSEPEMVVDIAGSAAATKTLSHGNLVSGLSAMGDRASRVRAIVVHSKSFYDLLGDAIAEKITNVADVAIYEGTTASMGRPIIVTDSPALVRYDAVDPTLVVGYSVLGLTEDAIQLNESEDRTITSELVTGKEQLIMRLQGEMAHTIGIKGFAYTGVASPTDAELGSSANYTYQYTTVKNGPGFLMEVE